MEAFGILTSKSVNLLENNLTYVLYICSLARLYPKHFSVGLEFTDYSKC
jgi:hypothetical protein